MTVGRFEQLVGAAGDVAELEYIAALHQTGEHVRRDASIQAADIRLFLSSRYGIVVTDEEVKETILEGLGGGKNMKDDGDTLDLMEVVGCLLIPTLLKAAQQLAHIPLPSNVVPANQSLLETVWSILLHDATGESDLTAKPLNRDLVKQILVAYGEYALSEDDELVDSMVEACQASDPDLQDFTLDGFADALTSDIHLYDLRNETRLTTIPDDVFLTHQVDARESSSSGAPTPISHRFKFTPSERNLEPGDTNISERLAMSRPVKRVHTLPQIDVTAGNYRSKILMILLWATFLITYFTYLFENIQKGISEACWESGKFTYDRNRPWRKNSDSIACEVVGSVFIWLFLFVSVSMFGVLFVTLGSLGNSVGCRRWWLPAIGGLWVFTWVFVLYRTEATGEFYLENISLVLGLLTAAYHFSHMFIILLPARFIDKYPKLESLLSSSSIITEMKLKQSAATKIVAMTDNALEMLETDELQENNLFKTRYGQALQTYAKYGQKYVTAGGFVWTWKRLLGEKAFASSGLWIPVRLIASNIAQFLVSLYTLIYGIQMTMKASENFDKDTAKLHFEEVIEKSLDTATDEDLVSVAVENVTGLIQSFLSSNSSQIPIQCEGYSGSAAEVIEQHCRESLNETMYNCDAASGVNFICPLIQADGLDYQQQLALLQASGLNAEMLEDAMRQVLGEATTSAVDSLFPSERYMVVIPAAVATVMAFVTAVYLAATYIPSVVNTILKLRCGQISTLRDPMYFRYRFAPDQVSILTGSLFWGALVSSIVVGGVFGALVFFFLWQATAYYAQRFSAILIGLIVVTVLRISFLQTQRRRLYKSFYRERPGAANLLLLGLEWANFSLTAGYIFARMIKLLLCAGACIGRIDTPFLAPGIGRIGPIELDVYPMVHMKDILSHEAHRHPYIEALGTIYLMKLRYGDKFGNRAGSCWRLIFVYVLMPWLHQYRVSARPSIAEGIEDRPHDEALMVPMSFLNMSQTFIDTRGSFVGTPSSFVQAPSSFLGSPSERVDGARRGSLLHEALSIRSQFANNPVEEKQTAEDSATKISELEQEIKRLKERLRRAEQRTASKSDVKECSSLALNRSRSRSEETV